MLGNIFDEPKLTVELIPQSQWGANLRTLLRPRDWDIIRKVAYAAAEGHCTCCGRPVSRLEAHERWEYDEETCVQKLTGVVALCKWCHEVKHFGRSRMIGRGPAVRRWLKEVNGWTEGQVGEYLYEVAREWERRSRGQWAIDLSWLEENGYEVDRG